MSLEEVKLLGHRELLWIGMSGGLAAAASVAVHQPLLLLKTHMQRPSFTLRGFLRLSMKYPVKTLYGGLSQRMLVIMPEKAFKMQGYEWTRSLFEGRRDQSVWYQTVKWSVSGAVAGVCTAVFNSPSELVTIQATVWRNSLREIVRVRGLRFLYTGWSGCVGREVVFGSIFFSTRHLIQRRFEASRGAEATKMERYWAGLISGTLASFMTTPFDVMKTRMQSINIMGGEKLSMGTVFLSLVRTEGARALWKGVVPRLLAVPSHLSFFYLCFEILAKKRETNS